MTAGPAIRTVAPAALPVSVNELKAQLNLEGINGDSEDAYLAGLIRVAAEEAENYTGLSLITSTWTQTFSAWPTTKLPDLKLWRRPLQAVTSIEYRDAGGSPAGLLATVSPSVYRVSGIGADIVPGYVRLDNGQAWPTALDIAEAVIVTYTAGFGADHNSVPESIRHAVLLIAATRYAYREDVVMGTTIAELPMASKSMLRYWRPLAVA